MSTPGSSVTLVPHLGADPESCTEHGYGLGRPDGILVVKYRTAGALDFGESRQDFLHQLYWSPDGILSARAGADLRFMGPGEAFWAPRGVRHEVHAPDWQTVYRVCLRQVPPALAPHVASLATVDDEAAQLIAQLARNGQNEATALVARTRIMAGLGTSALVSSALAPAAPARSGGAGYALAVARTLALDPADNTRLDEWAERLHLSVKTLQRDFAREFGMPFSQFRSALRLRAARALLGSHSVGAVAHRVGYSSPSAFVAAFTKEHGYTPGTHATQSH
ncbi:helix-turn-helix domain-containing protein [Tomitella biformata]|uniref:helix-turn-helix domain-containing protein n=1 Tax=Tomitella biformata TaxID=630403 RepID=UPI0004B66CE0|nr:AraC family transcriptional regulator [Tomitella biformata]